MNERARTLLKEYDVRGGEPSTLASSLSGGNQQKVAVAREVASNPKLLIAHQPTRGLDVGAIEFVHGRLLEERDKGRGILLVSLEFEEIRALADRILVIYEGQIVGRVPTGCLRGGARRGDDRRPRGPGGGVSATEEPEVRAATPASRLAGYVRGGGVIVPRADDADRLLHRRARDAASPGSDPIATYEAIWKGTGLQWIFPWTTGADRDLAASNLQQTLIITTPLILTGLAVAFAFRAGLFNIGGNGQYIVGSIAAVWVGSSFADMPSFLHIVLAIVAACMAGAVWAGHRGRAEGRRRRARGDHARSCSTGSRSGSGCGCSRSAGRCRTTRRSRSRSRTTSSEGAKLPVFWGDPVLQGLHIGLFIALGAALVFWIVLNRSTIGFEVRAVGFNPEAARYSGMSVAKNYILVMAVCGVFAGLAGGDRRARLAVPDRDQRHPEARSSASSASPSRCSGRNTAIGTVAAALLFGALLSGTSQRNLDPTDLRALAGREPDVRSSRGS